MGLSHGFEKVFRFVSICGRIDVVCGQKYVICMTNHTQTTLSQRNIRHKKLVPPAVAGGGVMERKTRCRLLTIDQMKQSTDHLSKSAFISTGRMTCGQQGYKESSGKVNTK